MIQSTERTKVIVRNLPAFLSEESFRTAVDKVLAGKYDWLSYFPGKASPKRLILSRAYINFQSTQEVIEFKSTFDGHVFVSTKGAQFR